MNPYYQDDSVKLYHGDCLEVLKSLADNSIDAVVTDPPYGLEFMGKEWDRPWAVTASASVGFEGRADNLTLPSHRDSRNANCRTCGGRQRGAKRCTCSQPDWDRDPTSDLREFQSWCTAWAAECRRVLKPGGHLLAFGGSRTWHRLTAGIEDAGFEIRDSIAWLYGSGFPKSLDVSKAIDKAAGAQREPDGYTGPNHLNAVYGNGMGGGITTSKGDPVTAAAAAAGWGTALKPAFEPVVVARKPLSGTVAANVVEHGTGALNIDACRIGADVVRLNNYKSVGAQGAISHGHGGGAGHAGDDYESRDSVGRWPTNVVLDESQAAELDDQVGILKSGANPTRRGSDKFRNAYGDFAGQAECVAHRGAEEGGASRFFPVFRYEAKAPTSERPSYSRDGSSVDSYRIRKRCTKCGLQKVNSTATAQCQCESPDFGPDPAQQGVVAHPTVKPLALMRWLVRLVTPPGGLVLDPFAGSGTTAEACIHEHMRCITVEREADYLPLIVARLSKPMAVGFNFGEGA